MPSSVVLGKGDGSWYATEMQIVDNPNCKIKLLANEQCQDVEGQFWGFGPGGDCQALSVAGSANQGTDAAALVKRWVMEC